MKEDLLVKLVYLSTGWVHDGRNKDTCIMCSDRISIPLASVHFITSQLCHSGQGCTCLHKVEVNGGSQTSIMYSD